jgi:hypothetical protein
MWTKRNLLRWMVALRLNRMRAFVGFCVGFLSWVMVNWPEPSRSHYVSVLEHVRQKPDYSLLWFAAIGIPFLIWILATYTFRFDERFGRLREILVSFYGGTILASLVYFITQIIKESSAFL